MKNNRQGYLKEKQLRMVIIMEKGLIHIYCGDGKGKTTAATGLAVRCAGAGGSVLWFQFLKRDISGERVSLAQLNNVTLISGYDKMKFTFQMTEEEKQKAAGFYSDTLKNIKDMVLTGNYDMLVLDETFGAINSEMISEDAIVDLLEHKPEGLEVVMTGREPSLRIMEYADYISEIKKIKHPYDKGIQSRRMIEY